MAIEIRVPRLGWSMEEGTLTEWLKQAGELVRKGDALFVLESEKATQDIESFDEGLLWFFGAGPAPGDIVRVGQVVALLLAEGEAPPTEPAPPPKAPAAAQARARPASPGGPAARRLARARAAAASAQPGEVPGDSADLPRVAVSSVQRSSGGPVASPRARRVALEKNLDLHSIRGTGRGGRIRERDVLAAASGTVIGRRRPISRVRQTIARRMLDSHLTTAPVTLTTEVDASNLVALREQFRAAAASAPTIVPSVNDFLMKLTALALAEHPHLNARWQDNQVIPSAAVHLGLAVDTEFGLLVPVVRNVEQLTLRQLAAQTKDLIALTQSRRLSAEQMQGGTFTLTSLGSYGVDAFTPILHDGQTAILGIGRICKRPAVVGETIVPRDLLTLSLTFDHRVVDGAPAARFLQTLSQAIERPAERLIN